MPKCFPSSLHIAVSVVSMEVFAPHKMAEIRLSAWHRGGPGSENKWETLPKWLPINSPYLGPV